MPPKKSNVRAPKKAKKPVKPKSVGRQLLDDKENDDWKPHKNDHEFDSDEPSSDSPNVGKRSKSFENQLEIDKVINQLKSERSQQTNQATTPPANSKSKYWSDSETACLLLLVNGCPPMGLSYARMLLFDFSF